MVICYHELANKAVLVGCMEDREWQKETAEVEMCEVSLLDWRLENMKKIIKFKVWNQKSFDILSLSVWREEKLSLDEFN